jgi:two-component system, sensor histidine kinase and response regulator
MNTASAALAADRTPAPTSALRAPLLLLIALVAVLATVLVVREYTGVRALARGDLESVADLRQTQIESMLRERISIARFIGSGLAIAELFRRSEAGDTEALERLMARLVELRQATDIDSVLLLDAHGRVLAREVPAHRAPAPELLAALQRAVTSGSVVHTGIYTRAGTEQPVRLDIVAPFTETGAPARGAFVWRIDPRRLLFPALRQWPVPSRSGETALWRRDGDRLVLLNDVRFRPADAPPLAVPLATSQLAPARVLRGEVQADTPIVGPDYRGVPVMATTRRIAGTDWWLVTKMDQEEIDAPARLTASWVAGSAGLVLLALFFGARGFAQRQALLAADTERGAQRARLEALQLLQAIADNSSDGIFAKDRDGRYLLCNRAASMRVGRTEADVLGRTDAELFDAATADRLREHDRAVMAANANLDFEEAVDNAEGARVQMVRKGPLHNADGELIGVFGVARDVTEQRRLLDELTQSRSALESQVQARTAALQQANAQLEDAGRFLRTVADNLPGHAAYLDRGLRLRFANRGYLEWFGTTEEQALGRHASEIADGDYFERMRGRLDSALAGEAQHFERETPRPGQPPVHHQVHYIPDRSSAGTIDGIFVMAFDISAQKRAGDTLRQARDHAEQANRAKSAFLANMSHEIRTPMNAIIGLTHLMERDARDAVARERLAKVDAAAHHLLQIINDILDLSKIEAGRLELEDIEFSLDRLVARAFEMVADTAQRKGLELVLDTDEAPDALRGDPTRLSQALVNLLANAVKFTERGWVRLTVTVDEADGAALKLRFVVHDTGVGIPPERLGALFSAFEQVDGSTSRRFGGTGLGLALTRRLASLMGGEAGVESELGRGSRFWFTARLGHGTGRAPEGPTLSGRHALLVDDLPEARSALATRLRGLGLRVDAVESGERALVRARDQIESGSAYDVFFIDWRMEPLDGIQTLRHLRALLGEGTPPAILVTAFDDAEMRRQALEAHFAATLVKPITQSSLHDTLQRVLRSGDEVVPLPAAGQSETALRERHAQARVLLAEDNLVNQEVSLSLLRAAGLQAELAADGAEAVEMAMRERYDAVLMDMQMPRLDGLEATRELRARGYAGPIIAMTANAFGDDRAACLAAGMNDHVAKPVDPEQLFAVLLRWLPHPVAAAPQAPPVDAAQALVERLRALQVIDVDAALRTAGGRLAVLERVLRRFVQHYADGVPLLTQPPGERKPDAWRLTAHSLQGACGAVGATALVAQAREVEIAAGGGPGNDALGTLGAALHHAVRDTAARLRQVLDA